jgi:hypothetical protein
MSLAPARQSAAAARSRLAASLRRYRAARATLRQFEKSHGTVKGGKVRIKRGFMNQTWHAHLSTSVGTARSVAQMHAKELRTLHPDGRKRDWHGRFAS